MPPSRVVAELKAQGRAAATTGQTPYHWAAAYGASAAVVLALGAFGERPRPHLFSPDSSIPRGD